jgi:hypothetical protein
VGWDSVPRYCGHFWPIVQPLMIDEDDFWSNWWNEDWQGKPKYSVKTCPSATLSTTKSHMTSPGLEPRTATVGSQWLTAWAMARPCHDRHRCRHHHHVSTDLSIYISTDYMLHRRLPLVPRNYRGHRPHVLRLPRLAKIHHILLCPHSLQKKRTLFHPWYHSPTMCKLPAGTSQDVSGNEQ